jgi:hypothetical protein
VLQPLAFSSNPEDRLPLDRTLELVLPFDIGGVVSDTAGSALTGRHQPAAREYSHLFGLGRVRMHLLSAWFQRVTGDS